MQDAVEEDGISYATPKGLHEAGIIELSADKRKFIKMRLLVSVDEATDTAKQKPYPLTDAELDALQQLSAVKPHTIAVLSTSTMSGTIETLKQLNLLSEQGVTPLGQMVIRERT